MTKKYAIRDKSILSLLYASGLRVSELTDLKLVSLLLEEGFIRVFGRGRFSDSREFLEMCINDSLPVINS